MVQIAIVDREAGEGTLLREVPQLAERLVRLDGDDLGARDHDLPDQRVGEVERVRQERALRLLEEARDAFDLGIVTEATEIETFDEVERVADLIQIGARNMQNFALLRRAGRSGKPVLLKRGPAATLEEWIFA
ncbi:MAG: hypothetical protein AABZ26_00985, partial [Chloroflexota bacterium]